MRPNSIIWFDRLYLAMIACNLVTIVGTLPKLEQLAEDDPALRQMGLDFWSMLNQLIVFFFVLLFVWFLISRFRSTIMKWLLTLFVAYFLSTNLAKGSGFMVYGEFVALLTVANMMLALAAVTCLHLPASRSWFAAKRGNGR